MGHHFAKQYAWMGVNARLSVIWKKAIEDASLLEEFAMTLVSDLNFESSGSLMKLE
jgi:hypothetical protein